MRISNPSHKNDRVQDCFLSRAYAHWRSSSWKLKASLGLSKSGLMSHMAIWTGEMMIIKPLECGEVLLFRHICLLWCQRDKCLQVALAIKRDKTKENNRCKISSNIQKLYFASLSKQSNLVIHGFQKTTRQIVSPQIYLSSWQLCCRNLDSNETERIFITVNLIIHSDSDWIRHIIN